MKKNRIALGYNIFFAVLSILFLLPILLMLSIAFSDAESLLQGYSFIPRKFSLDALTALFVSNDDVIHSFGISILVTVTGTILATLFIGMIGFVMTRKYYKPAKIIGFSVFFTMIFSGGLVPSYILITQYLNMRDTFWVMVLPTLIMPFHVILFRSFFSGISEELFESAFIDGADEFVVFFKIAVPISKPVIATVVLFTVMRYWNDWYTPMLYVSDDNLLPIQFIMYRMITNFEAFEQNLTYYSAISDFPKEPVKMMLAFITALPLLAVYPFLQRYFVKGITIGAVKG